jgi:hypothetical protein
MLASMTLLAEREQAFGFDQFPTAEADGFYVVNVKRDALAAAFAPPVRTE